MALDDVAQPDSNDIPQVDLAALSFGYNPFVLPATLPSTPAPLTSSSGKFGGYAVMNTTTSLAYLFIWDSTAAPTIGTNAPRIIIPLPYNATTGNGTMANLDLDNGVKIQHQQWYCISSSYSGAAQTSGVVGTLFVI